MRHQPVTYDYFWFFIIGAIVFLVELLLITPKSMNFLDKLADRKNQKNEKSLDEERKE